MEVSSVGPTDILVGFQKQTMVGQEARRALAG